MNPRYLILAQKVERFETVALSRSGYPRQSLGTHSSPWAVDSGYPYDETADYLEESDLIANVPSVIRSTRFYRIWWSTYERKVYRLEHSAYYHHHDADALTDSIAQVEPNVWKA